MTLRPPGDDDFAAMLELMNAHQLAAFGEADATVDELWTWLTAPSVDVQRDIRLLEADGRLVGYADVDGTRDDPPLWWCDVKVAPDVEAGPVLGELVGWLDERAGQGRLRVWTSAGDDRLIGAFEGLGFEHSRHSYRMAIDLAGAVRESSPPGNVVFRTVADGEELRIYEAVIEVWQDTSDPMDETFEEWQHWTTKAKSFDPLLWFLAVDGDELAGFSLCREDPNDSTAGHVAILGVRRPWRRQGLGEALLLHSFREFRSRGYTRSTLGVDASSLTGATRLYERAGMRVYRDTLFLERPVHA